MPKAGSGTTFVPTSAADAFLKVTPERGVHANGFFSRPRVITLCGSTRFMEAFDALNERLTLEGNVVFSVAAKAHEGSGTFSAEQKALLDHVHREKIRLSDEIFVINVGGYIGPSTRSEIEFAQRLGKVVRYLEP